VPSRLPSSTRHGGAWTAGLLSFVLPPLCAACRAPLAVGGPAICALCLAALPWIRGSRCGRCGLPRHRAGGCPAREAPFARAWAPLSYEGVARSLVGAVKFGARLSVAELMAAHLAANLPADLRASPAAVVVPVPPHRGRLRRRGYDPAGLIAEAFARRTERELEPCLRRDDRLAPLKRASVGARRAGGLRIECATAVPRAVLLVDDVHTTGTTLGAAAAALRDGGCQWVAAITYARTL
jgi:predicted amidophosphoribosyltransferase